MTIRLREYQTECIDTIKDTFKNKNRQLIQLPTGSGKTFIFLKYLSKYSKKSLIIVPTKELAEQVYENSFYFMDPSNTRVYKKKRNYMIDADHYIVTAQSLPFPFMKEWVVNQEFDHIVIDEAHRAYSSTYTNFLDNYSSLGYKPKIIGFTATPERFDRKPLLDLFDDITYDKTFIDLIKMNHLCDVVGYRINTKFNIKTKRQSKELTSKELRKFNNKTRNAIVIETFRKNCIKKKTLIFCVSVDHARTLAAGLVQEGFKAEAIYGDMSYRERQGILKRFKSGETMALCNCQLLTEGFDEPSIEDVIIARPTRSKSLYCQMIGRAVRKFPGKKYARIFELTDNCHNICHFEVAAGVDPGSEFEYESGKTLTEISKDLLDFDFDSISISKEEFSFFHDRNKFLIEKEPTMEQLRYIMNNKLNWKPFLPPLNFLEASFLIWKHKLGKKYGINKNTPGQVWEHKVPCDDSEEGSINVCELLGSGNC